MYTEYEKIPQPVGKVETLRRFRKKIGRNEKCFCGLNKKFKKCCINTSIGYHYK